MILLIPFYFFAYLFAEATQMGTAKEAKTILDMLTYRSAKSLGIPNYGIKKGGTADIAVFNTNKLRNVLFERPQVITLYKAGKQIY